MTPTVMLAPHEEEGGLVSRQVQYYREYLPVRASQKWRE
jgi:hypothetical protein